MLRQEYDLRETPEDKELDPIWLVTCGEGHPRAYRYQRRRQFDRVGVGHSIQP